MIQSLWGRAKWAPQYLCKFQLICAGVTMGVLFKSAASRKGKVPRNIFENTNWYAQELQRECYFSQLLVGRAWGPAIQLICAWVTKGVLFQLSWLLVNRHKEPLHIFVITLDLCRSSSWLVEAISGPRNFSIPNWSVQEYERAVIFRLGWRLVGVVRARKYFSKICAKVHAG